MHMTKPHLAKLHGRFALGVASAIAALIVMAGVAPSAAAGGLRLLRLQAAVTGQDAVLHGGGTRVLLPSGPFAICPVDRPRHYLDDFGDARYAGGVPRHQGIDIFAPNGTPIRAPFDGRVEASTSWAGGLQLYVYGGNGFAFNAHLSRTGNLGKVTAGTIVGYVGNSGDARGGSTHDHFEWHPKGGPAVDSYRLLNAVCRPDT
jgi:murein DD-endopeptidase MepM/ murein hydrolase activator NlpD